MPRVKRPNALHRLTLYVGIVAGAMLPFVGFCGYFIGVSFRAFPPPPLLLNLLNAFEYSAEIVGAVSMCLVVFAMWRGAVIGYKIARWAGRRCGLEEPCQQE